MFFFKKRNVTETNQKCVNIPVISYKTQTVFRSSRRIQQLRILKRCLAISVLDLGMNLPNYLLRLYLTVISEESFHEINGRLFSLIQDFSQLLYFAQASH